MACDPPRATGQPTVCAVTPKSSPKLEVSGRSSGRIAWAAQPAKTALASSSPNIQRARTVAGRRPGIPSEASAIGVARDLEHRSEHPRSEIGPQPGQSAVDPAPRRGVNPETVCCLVHRAADDRCPAIEHVSEREFRLHPLQSVLGERSLAKNGEAMPIGWTAEQMS